MSISQFAISEASISETEVSGSITPVNPVNPGTTNPYLNLITQDLQTPNFLAITDLWTRACWASILTLQNLPNLFNLDTAVGDQLDIIGEWIGFSRNISPGITSASFSWGVSGLGWGQAYWGTSGGADGVTVLPDTVYRQILYAKQILNSWNGSIDEIVQSLETAFPTNSIMVVDGQDMTMTINIAGYVNPLTVALIHNGYFNIRPAGVHITFNVSSIFFAWGVENSSEKGWSEGSWETLIYSI